MVKKLLILLLTFNTLILSSQVNFDVSVSKSKLGLNERFRVDFVMNQNGDNFSPPKFDLKIETFLLFTKSMPPKSNLYKLFDLAS